MICRCTAIYREYSSLHGRTPTSLPSLYFDRPAFAFRMSLPHPLLTISLFGPSRFPELFAQQIKLFRTNGGSALHAHQHPTSTPTHVELSIAVNVCRGAWIRLLQCSIKEMQKALRKTGSSVRIVFSCRATSHI